MCIESRIEWHIVDPKAGHGQVLMTVLRPLELCLHQLSPNFLDLHLSVFSSAGHSFLRRARSIKGAIVTWHRVAAGTA